MIGPEIRAVQDTAIMTVPFEHSDTYCRALESEIVKQLPTGSKATVSFEVRGRETLLVVVTHTDENHGPRPGAAAGFLQHLDVSPIVGPPAGWQ